MSRYTKTECALGIMWGSLYCKKCDEDVNVRVSRIDKLYADDSHYPVTRVLKYNCVCCNGLLEQYNLTKKAQEEWEGNAEYCSQNFRNYIVLRDQMRNEENN